MNRSQLKSCLLILVVVVLASCDWALAGGGPEYMLLVVNANDAGSKTIANYYINERHIPANNVLYLNWKLGDQQITVEQFRTELIKPILQFLERRELASQVDCIAYSSGFPWAIDFGAEVPKVAQDSPYFKFPTGSLTGMTYMFGAVLTKDATKYAGIAWNSNRYMRLRESKDGGIFELPTRETGELIQTSGHRMIRDDNVDQTSVGSHGFRSWYGWGPKGELLEAGGSRYILSAALGVTNGRANTVTEIVRYLRQSPVADGTFPKGTIYFMDNADIRSVTRKPGFTMAVDQLKRLGVNAQVIPGDIPKNRSDVQGLVAGIADFNWPASGSTILRGAICENLTSYSAIFAPNVGQTVCTEFLRYGATGTSGTVAEPYAQQNKFPHAMIQVHYARGCSLAEAFYQSVYMPYQLLILGDPLCRPWANIPKIKAAGIGAGQSLKGVVTLTPTADVANNGKCDRFELILDGQRIAACAAGGTLQFDSAKYGDGHHELRIVGFEQDPIETQGVASILTNFDNFGRTIEFNAGPAHVAAGRPIQVSVKCPGADGVAVYHNGQLLARISGQNGSANVDSRGLGDGPVTLTASGWSGGKEVVFAKPIKLFVQSGAGGK